MMSVLFQDLRYGVRQLRKSPGFTAAAVLTLALGIGANTAVFSLVNAVLLRPLPYADAERLYAVMEQRSPDDNRLASYPTFLDWKAQSNVFDGLSYVRGQSVNFKGPEGPEQLLAGYVSDDFFTTVGERPLLGRVFLPEESRSGGAQVAVISYRLWRRLFAGNPTALGQSMTLGDTHATIVGVMPPGFGYPEWAALWLPLPALPLNDKASLDQRGIHADSRVIGRLRTGIDLRHAQGEMDAIAARLASSYPGESAGWNGVFFYSLREQVLGDVKPRLLVLAVAVALVLLIGCANLINLSLARASARSRELAVRTALGAGRGRLIRQLLAESVLLVVGGCALGWLLADLAVGALHSSATDVLPRLEEVTVDGRVLGFALTLAAITTLLVGVLPALKATLPDLTGALKEGGQASGTGTRKVQLRSAVAVTEIALALVLLIGAGLLIRSFLKLQAVAPGFDVRGLVILRVMPPTPRYDDPERVVALYQRIVETVATVPGVRSVALTNHVPLTGASMPTRVFAEGQSSDADSGQTALFRTVSPGYFGTMRIPVLRGRSLTEADLTRSSSSILVNRTFALRYWPRQDPIGKRVTVSKSVQARPDFGQPVNGVVVGVVGDVRHYGLETDLEPEVYLPYTVNPPRWMGLVVRTSSSPDLLIPALRRAVLKVDPDLPVVGADIWAGFATMDQFLAQDVAPRRFNATLLGSFSVGALLLAVIGLYGVMAYLVTQRRHEIAVRMAVGAQRQDVLRLVLRQALRLTLVGTVLGLAGAVVLTRLMSSLLFGVTAHDPATFVAVALLLAGVALLASYIPARRATRVDPMIALRSE